MNCALVVGLGCILCTELKRHNAQAVVRVCEPSYKTDLLEKEGITVTDLEFDDGSFPPAEASGIYIVVTEWLDIVRRQARADPTSCVAVHCVAGLGRAPVLVALALMELGLKYEDAVELIREKRRGAINAKQLQFLEKYKPRSRLRKNGAKAGCSIQ
ncbi:Protein tyrosine phosphatase type IVA 1 [Amphibalanus amphitrite]|uniref:Protein tyrosine phosphatase type IVA 3 n=1 Tax=Amphibalanus amphitrite TaxID=1232801 RepID=A0A6A4WRV9_AMPAM|nr:Protein tyrosine phosphatase type IVA 1 [Amphibalanus amphitrite]KAF0304861.1 Protein tyrosine phosphatase type IVA 1 [Amphibalanus amphitrite]